MAGAQFTIPLITVIPGQLITASLWNNEFNNIATNFNPAGMDGYEDTDTQMQIQTPPYPGSVTSHASNLGGEIERIRYQISAILGSTTPAFWYAKPPTDLTTLSAAIIPVGGIFDYPSATAPSNNYHLADGTAINRVLYPTLFTLIGTAFGIGDGSTTFNIPNFTDRMSITAGNLYALAATGGGVASTPTVNITDPTHNHTQNSHTHTMANHTHSTPAPSITLDNGTNNGGATTGYSVVEANGTINFSSNTGGGRLGVKNTATGSAGTSGTPSTNTTDAGTATNLASSTGITAALGSGIQPLPPYIGLFKMMRVL